MGRSDPITFIRGPEGEILSSNSVRLPATHMFINPVAKSPIPVNIVEFQGEKEQQMLVPIDDWLKEHPDAKIIETTLAEWHKVKG